MRIHQIFSQLLVLFMITLFSAEAIAEKKYRVRSADNINSIVDRFYSDRSKSKAQIMVGILVENPRAFKGGNINFLLRGKRLNLLDESELSEITQENAQELLSQHTFYYKEGVTGVDYLLPPILSRKTIGNDTSQSNKQGKEQLLKISKLEEESNALKRRLDKLINEKKNRDQQLAELEDSIKKSQDDPSDQTGSVSQIVSRNKSLKETNAFLQRKLQKSQSRLAENTRSNIALERQVSTLKNQANEKPTDSADLNMTSAQEVITTKFDYQALWNKFYWILPVFFLILLFWYLIKLKKTRDIERDDDYASKIAENEENSFLQQGKDINDPINVSNE